MLEPDIEMSYLREEKWRTTSWDTYLGGSVETKTRFIFLTTVDVKCEKKLSLSLSYCFWRMLSLRHVPYMGICQLWKHNHMTMGVLVSLKFCWAPDIVEFVLDRFWYFVIAIAYSDSKFCGTWGVLVLLKFEVNSQKRGVQAPQNLEFD